VKQIDRNWPLRVKTSGVKEREAISSSDEFSSASAHSDDASSKKKKKSSGGPLPGFTGSSVTKMGTPNSHNSPSFRRKSKGSISRPPSTASPQSVDGHRSHRYPSLDDRLSMRDSLPDSRVQSSDESPISQNGEALVMAEPRVPSPPKNERLEQLVSSSFVPPKSSPASGVSSPRYRSKKVERGIQAKCTSTTREVQTGVFTKTAETMTSVEMKDAQTQKKLRKPKVSHFTHQFNGLKRSQAVQVERKMVSTGSQWSDGEHNQAVKKNKKLAKSFEFRQAVEQYRQVHTGRMADSILRRLHDHQKQGQLCDLTISIGGDEEPVRCHKHIVAMVSDVIQIEAMEKEEIFLSNISKDTLTQLIDYCYTAMIGPFVSKEQIEAVCDGIKKLKIRQLDMVVDQLQTGLQNGNDFFHSAISGTELISSDIITAAMMGQAIPTIQSSAGLIDLFDENGVNFDLQQDELTPEEEPEKPFEDLKTTSRVNLPFKKRIVQQDTPSDTDSDVEPPMVKNRPQRKPATPKTAPPVGRPRGRPRLTDKVDTPVRREAKVPKKRNLSDQNRENESASKVPRKSRRSLKEVKVEKDDSDTPMSVLDSLSEAEQPEKTQKPRRSRTPTIKPCSVTIEDKDTVKMMPASEKAKNTLKADNKATPKATPKVERTSKVEKVIKVEPKTPKEKPTPKKRKSVRMIPDTPMCPWNENDNVKENLALTNRSEFHAKTGHRFQCVYLANQSVKSEQKTED